MRIFLIGFMGSGKTFRGQELAQKLNIQFYDLDKVIEEKEGLTIQEVFASFGEEYFRVKEKETLEQLIDSNSSMVLSCGGGTPCFFNNIKTMKKYGITVWLNTHVEVILQRLLPEKNARPLIRDIPDGELRAYIVRKLNERRMYYEQADVTLDNEDSLPTNVFIQTILHA